MIDTEFHSIYSTTGFVNQLGTNMKEQTSHFGVGYQKNPMHD